jgi:hypothetical protein
MILQSARLLRWLLIAIGVIGWLSAGMAMGRVAAEPGQPTPRLVKDINLVSVGNGETDHAYPKNLTVVGDTLFFTAQDYTEQAWPYYTLQELWKTTGTPSSTIQLMTIDRENNRQVIERLVGGSTLLYFLNCGCFENRSFCASKTAVFKQSKV